MARYLLDAISPEGKDLQILHAREGNDPVDAVRRQGQLPKLRGKRQGEYEESFIV